MDTRLSPDDLAALISRCTGVPVTGEQVTDPSRTFDDLGVDSLGVMGVLSELQRNHGVPKDADLRPHQSPRELLALLPGRV
ncbi:minimal PKS acyl carrier protein [Lentzea fradiae]|uniref:Minimal PKS acyl carrier protein n=1 Tax=Lentzea fradiae TaxID=200378 RepID=A0A1G7LC43_9PSEU|nr:acyl carrier protein [Lentzea fradiae]SDF47087.1 minimal PKS acyl carrier protein [Lentzea fradiae]